MLHKVGTVISNKMQKTVVVKVTTMVKHALYKKRIKRTKNFKASDDIGVQVGQKVKIVETRPIAKDVHFKVMEVIE